MSGSECLLSSEEEFSLDDCDALLQFPWHQVKEEVLDDLPELGSSPNLILEEKKPFKGFVGNGTSTVDVSTVDPQLIEAAMKLNRNLQQKIILSLAKVADGQEKHKIKQEQIIEQIKAAEKYRSSGDVKSCVIKPIALFAAPYFRDRKGRIPFDNQDTITKRKNKDITAYNHPPRPWSIAEKNKLVQGVGCNALTYVLKPYRAKRDFLKSKSKSKNVTDAEIADLKKQIIYIERKMKAESQRLFKDLIVEAKDHIDWLMISATYMEGNRSEDECEKLWNNYLSPFVNKEKFTDKEDAHIRKLVAKYKGKNWDAVVAELKTNRSCIQVFERYQTKLNTLKKHWTPEEDKELLSLVETYKIGKYINWNKIQMDGRSRLQIINRYERTLCEEIRRDPFTPAEDAMMLACVSKFDRHWAKMQEFFIGRPLYNMRERFVNTLDPDLKMGCWSSEEDKSLIQLIKKFGYGKWSQISRHLPGRTDNMAYCRSKRLLFFSLAQEKKSNINWEYENATKLIYMLKPIPSTINKNKKNNKLKKIHARANEALRSAVKAIAHKIDEKIDTEKLDFSAVSTATLRLLCEELGAREIPTTVVKEFTPKYFHRQNRPNRPPLCKITVAPVRKRRRRETEYDSSSTNDEYSADSDEVDNMDVEVSFSDIEKIWLRKVLDQKFQEEALILFHNDPEKRKGICLTKRENLECSIYRTFLQKEYQCKNYIDEEDIEFFCSNDEYNRTLAQVTRSFIQPILDTKMIVIPPNCSTLYGFEVVTASELRLKRTANFAEHSMPYIYYGTGFSEEEPKCVACSRNRSDSYSLMSTYEQVVKDMKASFLVVDEVMQREAMIETRVLVDPQVPCQCRQLKASKKQFNLLAKRFISMFFWPFLMTTVGVTEEQMKLLYHHARKRHLSSKPGPEPKKRKTHRKHGKKTYSLGKCHVKKEYGVKKSNGAQMKKRAYVKKEIKQEKDLPPTRQSSRSPVKNRKFADSDEEFADSESE